MIRAIVLELMIQCVASVVGMGALYMLWTTRRAKKK